MQINSRDWIFEGSADPDNATPVWAQVGGLESFELDSSEGEETTDTTTFESAGVAESQPMQRGAKITLSGKIKRSADGATPDAGQKVLDDAAELIGEAALIGLRFRYTSDTDWTVWHGWVSKGTNGGGNNDKTTWAATFTRSGAASTEAVA